MYAKNKHEQYTDNFPLLTLKYAEIKLCVQKFSI